MFERLKKAIGNFVEQISSKTLSESDLDPLLWEFQMSLVECDVALPVAEELSDRIKRRLVGSKVKLFGDLKPLVESELRSVLEETLSHADLFGMVTSKKPFVIMFVGVNGTGKTTTIAKVAKRLKDRGISAVLACSDTYRAGSEEQIETHAGRLGLRVIKHRYGADPAAVAYDAVVFAKNNGIDVVLIDTAGRMQTDKDLMDELMKISRVASPDLTVFVGDSLAGNDALQQATEFSKYVKIDGIILTKVDADSKGGSAISISNALKKPIFFVGVGQGYDDIVPFDPKWVIENVLSKPQKK
ncbi:MAG: signal recognition particle-docking protein FtsY [Candidatus Verstraetearchaeota archaeon]|nr:signal recognition particle-docking protein FtsY [Candidatus Verstraetearchaeota archaeon]